MNIPKILILDYGSQYTHLIERCLRELGFRSVIFPPGKAERFVTTEKPKAIILSGSDRSVNDSNALDIPDVVLRSGVPILGICYGMQLLAKRLGGEVRSGTG